MNILILGKFTKNNYFELLGLLINKNSLKMEKTEEASSFNLKCPVFLSLVVFILLGNTVRKTDSWNTLHNKQFLVSKVIFATTTSNIRFFFIWLHHAQHFWVHRIVGPSCPGEWLKNNGRGLICLRKGYYSIVQFLTGLNNLNFSRNNSSATLLYSVCEITVSN